MPLSSTVSPPCDECHGFQWLVENEDKLSEIVGMLMLGQHRHVLKIIRAVDPNPPGGIAQESINNLIKKLDPDNIQGLYHRDGWVFQMISWIAAMISSPDILSAPPQSQSALPGFDNLLIRLDENKAPHVIIGEDKASENNRDTLTQKVWKEFKDFEAGRRDNELLNEVTSILERNQDVVDVDKCLTDLFWLKDRYYRVCVAVDKELDDEEVKSLFKGYAKAVPGGIDKRQAETFVLESMRDWMNCFCFKISEYLRGV